VPSKSVGAIDVDKAGYVSRDDDTDDADGQRSERKGSDSDCQDPDNNACEPGEDDADGQGSERKGSDSDSQDPDNNADAQNSTDMTAAAESTQHADDPESERLLQECRAIAGVEAPGPASKINPEKMEADDTQELQDLRLQPRRHPARALQKIPRYKEASSSVNSKDVDNAGALYRTVISLSPMPFRSTHVTSP
jgi:hypothetical protein